MEVLIQKKSALLRMKILFLMMLSLIPQKAEAGHHSGFSSKKASFSVKFKDIVSCYKVISAYVLPGETLRVEAESEEEDPLFVLQAAAGAVEEVGTTHWEWKAPAETGVYPIEIRQIQSDQSITLNIFVMIPFNQLKGEYINGYHIGAYPSVPLRLLPNYQRPKGFIEVTRDNEDTLVSPHYTLMQFLCKQEGGYPKYMVLQEKLLLKLELLLEKANEKGYQCDTFQVMSGYRTPYYNRSIGNVRYSCHLWGMATDIFIDENPRDGVMDDLNHDGRINRADAAILCNLVDEICPEPIQASFLGGLGIYRASTNHGPFVHVDVRGTLARWTD